MLVIGASLQIFGQTLVCIFEAPAGLAPKRAIVATRIRAKRKVRGWMHVQIRKTPNAGIRSRNRPFSHRCGRRPCGGRCRRLRFWHRCRSHGCRFRRSQTLCASIGNRNNAATNKCNQTQRPCVLQVNTSKLKHSHSSTGPRPPEIHPPSDFEFYVMTALIHNW